MNHTPVPWETAPEPHAGGIPILTGSPFVCEGANTPHCLTIAMVSGGRNYEEMQANAQFIVRACNSHFGLLAALEGLMDHIEQLNRGHAPSLLSPDRLDKARAAIAKARQP